MYGARPVREVFERDDGRCVLCGMDLLQDLEHFMLATTDSLQTVVGEGGGTQVTPVLCCSVCKERLAGMDRRTPLALRRRHLAKADGDSRTELDALRRDRSIGWSRPQGTQLERAVVAAVGQLITEFQEQPGGSWRRRTSRRSSSPI